MKLGDPKVRYLSRKMAAAGLPLLSLPLLLSASAGPVLAGARDAAVARPSAPGPAPNPLQKGGEPRLISLAPSNTELLYSIGAGQDIIGVCSFCDFPSGAENIKKVGTFVSANLERICRLKPDYVLLVSGQEMLSAQIAHNRFKTILLDNSHLHNIGPNLVKLGQLTGKAAEAKEAASNFDSAVSALKKIVPPGKNAPAVFYCVWPQPLMTAGRECFLNEVLTACGGTNIAGNIAASYPRYSMEQLVLKNPDVIILPYEAKGQSFLNQAPWTMLKAVKEKRLYYLPDQKHDMLSRPTLRVLRGMAWLAGILHPERQVELEQWQKSEAFVHALGATGTKPAAGTFH